MYLELKNIHKSFGSGDKPDRGAPWDQLRSRKRRYLCFTWTIRFGENPPY